MRLAEEALPFSVGNLRREGRWRRSGTIRWGNQATIAFRVVEYLYEAEVLLDWSVNAVPMHQKIECESTEQRIGRRWWFLCPGCRLRFGVLYLPAGEIEFRCRDCHNVRYRSQGKDMDKYLKPLMAVTGKSKRWVRETLNEMNRASLTVREGANAGHLGLDRGVSAGH